MVKNEVRKRVNRNQAKYQVFAYVREYGEQPYGARAQAIAKACPAVSLKYLQSRLDKWVSDGYIKRCKARRGYDSRRVYRYRLTSLGLAWYSRVIPSYRRREAERAIADERLRVLAEFKSRMRRSEPVMVPGDAARVLRIEPEPIEPEPIEPEPIELEILPDYLTWVEKREGVQVQKCFNWRSGRVEDLRYAEVVDNSIKVADYSEAYRLAGEYYNKLA